VKTLTLDLLARSRIALGWWVLGMLSMGAYVVFVYDSIGSLEDLHDLYERYPESIRELFGEVDIGTLNGWIHLELLSWLPLVLGVYGGIFAAGSISRETETRTVDFILGLPVSRVEFMTSRLIVGLANMAAICGLIFALLVITVPLTGHDPAAGKYTLALFNAYLLGAALFTAYALIASFVDEQARLIGVTIGATLVMYIATAALNAANAPDVVQWVSPFEHYHSADAMSGRDMPVLPLVALFTGAVITGAAAIYWYNRRDLAV
jgi:ABC-type transport system involved in multi-copper enzyme maturation permease subunit